MNSEQIILYIFKVTLGILGPIIAYLPVRYLNQKALGMQTVFDQMMKDLLYLIIFKSLSIFPIMDLVREFLMPVNHYLAIVATALNQFLTLIILWQYSVLIGVRFLSVFHPTYLSNENLIKNITRGFISIISGLSILSSDLENSILYNLLSGKKPHAQSISKPVIVSSAICIIAQIIVQYKLEMFKKTVDSRCFDEIFNGIENQRRCESRTRFYTHRVEFGIMACPFLFGLYMSFFGPDDIYITLLRVIVFFQIIFLIAFPGVIIYKNDNMCSFICKLFGQLDTSKKYMVHKNQKNDDTLASACNVDQDDINYSKTNNLHEFLELSVLKVHGTQENPISHTNPKDTSHVKHSFHSNVDKNTMPIIDDPMPGCSHW